MEIQEFIIKNTAGNVFWKDLQGRYLGCNTEFAEIARVKDPHDIVGKTDRELFLNFLGKEGIIALEETDRTVFTKNVVIIKEEVGVNKKGEIAYFFTKKIPLKDDNNNIIGVMGTAIDITRRVEAEKKLQLEKIKAESSSKSKSEFIANMSHDIRTPITGMLGMVQDMMNTAEQAKISLNSTDHATNPVLDNIIDTVHHDGCLLINATDELLQLCNEILEVTRLESGIFHKKQEAFNLHDLIHHHLALFQPTAHHKKLHLSSDIDQSVPIFLQGFRLYLDRILLNLMSNALKFTETGSVHITVTLLDHGPANVAIGDKINLQMTVEDTGIGIPEDKFDKVFENFSRLTPAYEGLHKGAGLGLYTVKRYIEAMLGKISIQSKINQGTCFTLVLPFIVTDHADVTQQPVHSASQVNKTIDEKMFYKKMSSNISEAKASILVVEDNKLAAVAVILALKPFCCHADIADTGTKAVEMAQKGHYDLILMDIGLPDFSGTEATKKIRAFCDAEKATVPIIALTGHASDPEMREEMIQAGMQDIMSKPAQPAALGSILQHYVFKPEELENTTQSMTREDNNTSTTLPIIDWDACVRMCNGDPRFTRKMLGMLYEDVENFKPLLAEAYASHNCELLLSELHRIRGGVCYLKVPQFEQSLKSFHEAIKNQSQQQQKLEETYKVLQNTMTTFLNTWKSKQF